MNVFVVPLADLTIWSSTTTEIPKALPVRFLQTLQWQATTHNAPRSVKRTAPQLQPPSRNRMDFSDPHWTGTSGLFSALRARRPAMDAHYGATIVYVAKEDCLPDTGLSHHELPQDNPAGPPRRTCDT